MYIIIIMSLACMIVTYLGFNIVQVFLASNVVRFGGFSWEISRDVCKLAQTLTGIKKNNNNLLDFLKLTCLYVCAIYVFMLHS